MRVGARGHLLRSVLVLAALSTTALSTVVAPPPAAAGEPLCTIHCHSDAQASRARKLLEESYEISGAPPAHRPSLIHRVIHKGER